MLDMAGHVDPEEGRTPWIHAVDSVSGNEVAPALREDDSLHPFRSDLLSRCRGQILEPCLDGDKVLAPDDFRRDFLRLRAYLRSLDAPLGSVPMVQVVEFVDHL